MFRGTIPIVSVAPPEALAAHLARALESVEARSVSVQANRVSFKGGLFRMVDKWNVLVAFERGEIVVEPMAVSYRLSIRQLLLSSTLAIAFFAIMMLLFSKEPKMAAFLPIIWAWLVGGNLCLGLPRFHRFLKRSIAAADGFEVT